MARARTPMSLLKRTLEVDGHERRRAMIARDYLARMGIAAADKHGGDPKDNYLFIVYPGQKLLARAAVTHWPMEEITQRADELFAQWGGIEMARRIAAAM
jgi:hypothetical protein